MGKIEVAPRAIATIAARAVGQSYGVVGMAPHTFVQGVAQVLRKEDAHKGVAVRIGDDEIAIDLYVILSMARASPRSRAMCRSTCATRSSRRLHAGRAGECAHPGAAVE